jgi:hypothetical protein
MDETLVLSARLGPPLLTGARHDLWAVNADSGYHEEDVPEQPDRNAPETPELEALRR